MEPWYAAKCIFKHNDLATEDHDAVVYEERIILVKADDEDSAIIKAEVEAQEYIKDLGETEFIGYTNIYNIFEESLEDLSEVFSEMRESNKMANEYLDHFYDTGKERAR